MLDLAILIDCDFRDVAIIETNHGQRFKAPDWPTDTDPKVVAFWPASKSCEVVDCDEVANDIGCALEALKATGAPKNGKPGWYERLELYAAGASSISSCTPVHGSPNAA
jgi:hypothetical protein